MKERIVCVEWEDASWNSGYYDKDKPKDYTPVLTRTVGHLIKKDKAKVIVSTERFYSDGKLENERHINTIPRKMIKRVIYLKEVEDACKK